MHDFCKQLFLKFQQVILIEKSSIISSELTGHYSWPTTSYSLYVLQNLVAAVYDTVINRKGIYRRR